MHIKTKRPTLCSMNLMFIVNFFRAFFPHLFPVFPFLFRLQVSAHTLYYWHLLMTAARQSLLLCSLFFSVSIFNNAFSLEMLGESFLWVFSENPVQASAVSWSLAKSSWALESNWSCFSTHFYCNFTSLFLPSFIFAFCFDSALVSLVCRHAISQSERKKAHETLCADKARY